MSGTDDLGVLVVDDDFMVARIHTQIVERTQPSRNYDSTVTRVSSTALFCGD